MTRVGTYLESKSAAIAATMKGGAHNTKVTVVPKPMVALSVGKKALKDKPMTLLVIARASQ